jgi:predicted SprT family Zn-dependent metalloprotease
MVVSCPKCRETSVRRSHRRLFLDFLYRSIGMVPYRCNACEHRFFRFRKHTVAARGG